MEWTNGGRYAKRCKLRFNAREAANQDSSWKQDRHPGMSVSNNPSDWMREKASTPREMPCVSPGKLHKREPPYGSLDLGKQRPVYPARMVRSHRVHGRQCWQSVHSKPARHRCMGDMDSAVSETLTSTHGGPFKEDAWQTINPKASLFQTEEEPGHLAIQSASSSVHPWQRRKAGFGYLSRNLPAGKDWSFQTKLRLDTHQGDMCWTGAMVALRGKMGRRMYGTAWGWRAPIEW